MHTHKSIKTTLKWHDNFLSNFYHSYTASHFFLSFSSELRHSVDSLLSLLLPENKLPPRQKMKLRLVKTDEVLSKIIYCHYIGLVKGINALKIHKDISVNMSNVTRNLCSLENTVKIVALRSNRNVTVNQASSTQDL